MKAFGIPDSFLKIVEMLFHGAKASIYTSRGESSPFHVLCKVHQRCPLAPYLFLFIGEVLNNALKKAAADGSLSGIISPENINELSIIQYADDTNLMIAATESNFTTVT